jgi:hypothetical protein
MAKTLDIQCQCGNPRMRFCMSIVSESKIGNLLICDECGRSAYYLFPLETLTECFERSSYELT